MIQYRPCSQLDNDKRFVEIIKVIFEISEKLNLLRGLVKGCYLV